MISSLALGPAAGGCSNAEEACALVHEASCPADFPRANPDFAYDYRSPDAEQTDCVKSIQGPCASEFQEYVDCLTNDPVCCQNEGPDGYQCTENHCSQEAYGDCVAAIYRERGSE
ncbi:MAG: hypothetical protein ABI193_23475 [Minicystis sp.]